MLCLTDSVTSLYELYFLWYSGWKTPADILNIFLKCGKNTCLEEGAGWSLGEKETPRGHRQVEDVFQPTLTSRGHKNYLPLAHVFLASVILFLPLRHILDLKFLLYIWALSGSVCACVDLCTYVCAHVYVCEHACTYVHVHACLYAYVCGLVCICAHIWVLVHMCILCVCVCTHLCLYICTHTHVLMCMCVHTCVCLCVCMYSHPFKFVHMCMCAHVCACMCTYWCMLVHMCLYEYMCMHICVYVFLCPCVCCRMVSPGMTYLSLSWAAGSSDYPHDTCTRLGPLTSFMKVGEGLIGSCLLPNDGWTVNVNGCLEPEVQCSSL